MPRLFTGIAIPAEVKLQLGLLRGGLPGARWIEPEDYHLTLRFIGDIDDDLAEAIFENLASIRRGPVKVTLAALTAFGGDRPRSIVARAEPAGQLLDLQAEHERIIRQAGAEPETRKFVPHVTLAYLRRVDAFTAAAYLGSRTIFTPLSFTTREFLVYSSRALKGGGPYVAEAAYALG